MHVFIMLMTLMILKKFKYSKKRSKNLLNHIKLIS